MRFHDDRVSLVTNLIVDRVPLCDDHAVDTSFLARARGGREITQGPVKLPELVDSLIANQGFADEEDFVGTVCCHQLLSNRSVTAEGLVSKKYTFARARIKGCGYK